MTAYYNEHDPKAAAWLRELSKAGLIAPGIVDERSIDDVVPTELAGYTQCHFFAGIGVWSYALRNAGWPDDRPVWTGSCPCQPFSSAGKGTGHGDERHLWPAFFHLIEQCRPRVVFGEQVEAAIRHGWLDLVSSDMEGIGYSFGAVGLPACGFGAPHIRQRLFFVADAEISRGGALDREPGQSFRREEPIGGRSVSGIVADAERRTAERHRLPMGGSPEGSAGEVWSGTQRLRDDARDGGDALLMGNSDDAGPQGRSVRSGSGADELVAREAGPVNGFWRNADWLPCRDGKARPVEPGTFPLVDGTSARVVSGGDSGVEIDPNATGEARVMRLKGYGNAIVESYLEGVTGA